MLQTRSERHLVPYTGKGLSLCNKGQNRLVARPTIYCRRVHIKIVYIVVNVMIAEGPVSLYQDHGRVAAIYTLIAQGPKVKQTPL